jgi:uncharacterized membrane protein (UPF0127 family)
MRILLPLVFALVIPMVACDGGGGPLPAIQEPTPASPSPTVDDGLVALMLTGNEGRSAQLRVELASTQQQRERGLMFRKSMPENQGMLFLFPREESVGFWMKNTEIPLTVAYIGADGQVLELIDGEPFDETVLLPSQPYRYVIEVNKGWFERNGLGPGARVTLPGDLPEAQ